MRDPIAAAYARAHTPRDVALTVATFAAAAAVAARGDLVATLPQSLFDALGARLGLVAVIGPIPSQPIAMSMCWHERTHDDPAARALRMLVSGVLSRP